jgi:hypothetical protein
VHAPVSCEHVVDDRVGRDEVEASDMAGLGTDDQKNAIAATAPIATAFKFCIRHRKSGLLNRLPIEVRVWCF